MGPSELPLVGDSRGFSAPPFIQLPGSFNNSIPKEGGGE